METAELMFNHIFRYYGIPEDIVSNCGPQFISKVWKAFFALLGVTVSLSSGYHPQSNGQTERKIQEIGCFMRTFCHGHNNSWNQFLGWDEYAQNSLCQPSTGLTPFQCILCYQPPLFPWSREPSDVPSVNYWFRESERVWDTAHHHHHLQRAVRRRKMTAGLRRAETPTFQPGQKVWLSTRDIRMHLLWKKLSPRYVGPFTIIKQINPVTYQLQLPSHYRIHSSFHISLLKPYHPPVSVSTEPGPTEEPPLPLIQEDGVIYKVNEILDSRCRGGLLEYLVDWEGYGLEEWSWVPRDDILNPTLQEAFHSAHPDRPWHQGLRPSGAGRGGGGTVTDQPGSFTTHSHCTPSPEYWFHTPALHLHPHQDGFISTNLTPLQCPVSFIRSGLSMLLQQNFDVLTSCAPLQRVSSQVSIVSPWIAPPRCVLSSILPPLFPRSPVRKRLITFLISSVNLCIEQPTHLPLIHLPLLLSINAICIILILCVSLLL